RQTFTFNRTNAPHLHERPFSFFAGLGSFILDSILVLGFFPNFLAFLTRFLIRLGLDYDYSFLPERFTFGRRRVNRFKQQANSIPGHKSPSTLPVSIQSRSSKATPRPARKFLRACSMRLRKRGSFSRR